MTTPMRRQQIYRAYTEGGDQNSETDDDDQEIMDKDYVSDDDKSCHVLEDSWTAGAAQASDGAIVDTGKQDWGEVGLALARRLLEEPERAGLLLFSLRAVPGDRSLHVAIDKPEDRFGSPAFDELDSFGRDYNAALEASLGKALADDILVEVSSPGAERLVRIPRDLERFSHLPMLVKYEEPQSAEEDQPESKRRIHEKVFLLKSIVGTAAEWNVADVRINRDAFGKGRRLGKKKLQEVHCIDLKNIQQINLHLDI